MDVQKESKKLELTRDFMLGLVGKAECNPQEATMAIAKALALSICAMDAGGLECGIDIDGKFVEMQIRVK